MVKFKKLTDVISVSEQIEISDIDRAKDDGFTILICNRPDYEEPGQPLVEDIKARVGELGMKFIHIPISGAGVTLEAVNATKAALEKAEGPVLAYCRTGTRSTNLWALARAMSGKASTDEIIKTAAGAGYNLDGLRPTLDSITG